MLLVSLELTLPESHRLGLSSCAALDATRTSYAVCRPADRRQLSSGVASPSPVWFVCVLTRSVVADTVPAPVSPGALAAPINAIAPAAVRAANRIGMLFIAPPGDLASLHLIGSDALRTATEPI